MSTPRIWPSPSRERTVYLSRTPNIKAFGFKNLMYSR